MIDTGIMYILHIFLLYTNWYKCSKSSIKIRPLLKLDLYFFKKKKVWVYQIKKKKKKEKEMQFNWKPFLKDSGSYLIREVGVSLLLLSLWTSETSLIGDC